MTPGPARHITGLQRSVGRIFGQRCFYLFVALVLLIAAAPFTTGTAEGRIAINALEALVLVAAVAAVGRTMFPFVVALLLAAAAFAFDVFALAMADDSMRHLMASTAAYLAFYLVAVVYLLRYVFSPQVMTDDKLFGAAAGYMMLGLGWTYAYRLVQFLDPRAFGVPPGGEARTFYDLLYMSFGILTSNGTGDLVPTGARVKTLVVLQQVVGTLYVAILIARLAGIYPAKREP